MRVPLKPEMVCRALTDEDARRLAAVARSRQDRHGLAVILGLYQGMRREEIATTRWDAISEDGQWLAVIGKGTKTRRLPLHAVALEALAAVSRSGEWVFPGRFGGSASTATIGGWIRAVADEAGVGPVRPHELRHTCLATQNDRTGDLRAVQAFAGHSKPETTSGYTRAQNEAVRRVVEALGLLGGGNPSMRLQTMPSAVATGWKRRSRTDRRWSGLGIRGGMTGLGSAPRRFLCHTCRVLPPIGHAH